MQYGLIYRSAWLMMDDNTEVTVNIYKTDVLIPDDDTPTVIDMIPYGSPLSISVINNDRNKLTSIRAKQAEINVLTESLVDITTFTGGPDNLWYVEIKVGATTLFIGYLVTADVSQPFLPNPRVLTLTASDCLGLLKDVPLTTLTGGNPTGKIKIGLFLGYALNKTGLALPIRVVNSLRHGSGITSMLATFTASPNQFITAPSTFFYVGQELIITGTVSNNTTVTVTGVGSGIVTIVATTGTLVNEGPVMATFTDTISQTHFYNNVYLDAKTFEEEIGESENCYTVLEKILGFDCFLTQYKGEWWIVRVDEYDENQIYVANFTSEGVFVDFDDPTDYNISIGPGEDYYAVLADQTLQRDRPVDVAKLVYDYNSPIEIPCNKDFERGDLIDGSDPARKKYELECWTQHQENYPTSGLIAASTDIYVIREFNNIDYEVKRYVVIEAHDPSSNLIKSEPIPVHQKDKISVGMSRRMSEDVSGSGFYRDNGLQVRLIGDDGTYWTLQGETSTGDTLEWVESDVDFLTFNKYLWFEGDVERDMTESESLYGNTESPEIPVDGDIYLLAHQTHQADWNRGTYIESIDFNYIPYINGSYQDYSGQHQKVTRPEDGYLAKIDDTVYISDSPKKIFKGAMFIVADGAYVLTTKFFPANVFPALDPPEDTVHPYGELQIRSVFNQYVYPNWIVSGSVKGLAAGWPDMINKFILTYSHPATNDRYFMMVSMEQDWKLGIMNATFIEVYDRVLFKRYTDEREFKYITNG